MKPSPADAAVADLLQKYAQGERDFSGISLNECTLSGAKLPYIILRGADLRVVNLSTANLSHGDLQRAVLNVSRLSGANLSQTNLQQAQLNVANLIRAVLVGANLSGASLIRSELLRADLSNANLTRANLQEADLREVRLRWANLSGANLSRCNIRNSSLLGANLSNVQAHSVNLEAANLSGASLMGFEGRHANLRKADLSGANLRGANLRWANLNGANLQQADLTDAKLSGADLMGAQLEGATLENTTLVHTDLSRANLRHVRCVGSDLSGATLTGAQMSGAIAYEVQTAEIICEWIDLSPLGDAVQRRYFNTGEDIHTFLNQRPAQVNILVDGVMTLTAHAALAQIWADLAQRSPVLSQPPNVELTNRHTQFSFMAEDEAMLSAIAYLATWPFSDGATVQQILSTLMNAGMTRPQRSTTLEAAHHEVQRAIALLKQQDLAPLQTLAATHPFFTKPLQVKLVNARGRTLELYANAQFGIRNLSSAHEVFPVDLGRESQPILEDYLAFLAPSRQ